MTFVLIVLKKTLTTIKKRFLPNKKIRIFLKGAFWFSMGVSLGLFLLTSFIFIYFQQHYVRVIYPGIVVNGIDFGGKTKEQARAYFEQRNAQFASTTFVFRTPTKDITTTAQEIEYGYDSNLLSEQAYTIGRSDNMFSNLSLVFQAYAGGIYLPPAYRYSENILLTKLEPIIKEEKVELVDALFRFQDGKVATFRPSSEGKEVDIPKLKEDLESKKELLINRKAETFSIEIPIRILQPNITTNEVNNLGIKELVGTGTSLFAGSIPNRIYNITLAAQRLDGVLVAPNEVFSFNKALGDISKLTGFKQAYVIENGKTVLGDGGGVCQVSTTFFRALLNAGVPIIQRHAHAYRVSYYEQDSGPGFDAAIYTPSVDLSFKNDTGHHILIQTIVDQANQRISFFLYGTSDGRIVTLSKPIITSTSPAPEPKYEDDPTLPKGVVKQIDFAAAGASVYFTREVKQNGKTIISEKYTSNYRPWQAIYLRGTQ